MIPKLLEDSWRIYRANFGLIAAIVFTIWLPYQLAQNYRLFHLVSTFAAASPATQQHYFVSEMIWTIVGLDLLHIITFTLANAALILIAAAAIRGDKLHFSDVLAASCRAWGRLLWTNFLVGFAVLLGLLCLVIPGIYLIVRLAFINPVVVLEGSMDRQAAIRSFELTRGNFWTILLLFLVNIAIAFVATIVLKMVPAILIPALNTWLPLSFLHLLVTVAGAFGVILLFTAYHTLSSPAIEALPAEGTAPG